MGPLETITNYGLENMGKVIQLKHKNKPYLVLGMAGVEHSTLLGAFCHNQGITKEQRGKYDLWYPTKQSGWTVAGMGRAKIDSAQRTIVCWGESMMYGLSIDQQELEQTQETLPGWTITHDVTRH